MFQLCDLKRDSNLYILCWYFDKNNEYYCIFDMAEQGHGKY